MKSLRFACFFAGIMILLVAAQPNSVAHANHPNALAHTQKLPAAVGAHSVTAVQAPPVRFAKPVTYGSGAPSASSIFVADVNRDGKPDLLVANQCPVSGQCNGSSSSEATVGVLLGNGDGTFRTAVTYGSGGLFSYSIAVADVNGDGEPDLLVTNQCSTFPCSGDSTVGVLLGNGDGTFQTAATYDSGGFAAVSVAVGDVNGDGKPDLIVANECVSSSNCANGGGVSVLLGNGDGTFQTALTYELRGIADSVAVADVNGDGKLDLLVANYCLPPISCGNDTSGTVAVLLGNGDGTFQSATNYSLGGYGQFSVTVADVNRDGKLDMLITSQCIHTKCGGYGTVGVLLGNGDGTFQRAVNYGSGGHSAFSVAVADVNGDGKFDLLVTSECNIGKGCPHGVVGVLLGNGDGTFQTAVTYDSGGSIAWSLAVGDFNGDGKPDVAVADDWANVDNENGTVGVLLNDFTATTAIKITSSPNPARLNQAVTFTVTITSNPNVPKRRDCNVLRWQNEPRTRCDGQWGSQLDDIFLQSQDPHHQSQVSRRCFSQSQLGNGGSGGESLNQCTGPL
jgi:hypothetical protein